MISDHEHEKLVQFLDKDGAIEFIHAIGSDGARRTAIESATSISAPTISKRWEESRNIGLVTRSSDGITGNKGKLYQLTDYGERVYNNLKAFGIIETLSQLQQLKQDYENQRREFITAEQEFPGFAIAQMKTTLQLSKPDDETYEYEVPADTSIPETPAEVLEIMDKSVISIAPSRDEQSKE